MKYLLDTHAFLWWITDDERLTSRARERIKNRRNQLYLSAASAWEMAIKARLGRLQVADDLEKFIPKQMALNAIHALPVQVGHALRVFALPPLHNDPFDRLLVAQSQMEDLPIITGDPQIAKYDLQVIW